MRGFPARTYLYLLAGGWLAAQICMISTSIHLTFSILTGNHELALLLRVFDIKFIDCMSGLTEMTME